MGACTIAPKEGVTQSEIQGKIQVPAHGYEMTEGKKLSNILLLLELGTQSLSRLFLQKSLLGT